MQNDWDIWLLMTEFADNNTDSAAITLSLFFMNHRFHLQMSFKPDLTSYEMTWQCLQTQSAEELTVKINKILTFIKQHLTEVCKTMLRQINQHWKNVNYEIEDIMFLDSKNIKTQRSSKKTNDKILKLFKIIKKVKRAFQLKLLKIMLIHNVFHLSLL